MKAFFNWKNLCCKLGQYYPKIIRAFNILIKYDKKIYEYPFELISIRRNFLRLLNKLFRGVRNEDKRLLNEKLLNLFERWLHEIKA